MIATSLTSSSKGELSLAIGWFWCNPFFEKGKKITNKKRKNFHWVIFAIFLFNCTAACFHVPSTENVSFNHINSKDLRDHALQISSRSCLVKFPCSIFYALDKHFSIKRSWTIPISLLLGSAQRFVVFSIIILLTNLGFPIIFVNIEWLNFSNIILNFDLLKFYLDLHYKSQYS